MVAAQVQVEVVTPAVAEVVVCSVKGGLHVVHTVALVQMLQFVPQISQYVAPDADTNGNSPSGHSVPVSGSLQYVPFSPVYPA